MSTGKSARLSILISCFNQREFIADAIRSFFQQDWENREIIVLDDGSTDDSMSVIAGCAANAPCPVKYAAQENHGASYTFSKLAQMATGDYLLFCGGDDLVPPDCLKQRMELLENDPELMMAGGACRYFIDNKPGDWFCPPEKVMELNEISADTMLDAMRSRRPGVGEGVVFTACIVRKSDYLAAGGFSQGMKCDDSILFYNLFQHARRNRRRFQMIPELVFYYRQHEHNISKDPQEMWTRFSELYTNYGFCLRRQASFSAYAAYMKAVRADGRWIHKELLKRIWRDPAVIKYLTFGAICRDLFFPRFGRF